MVDTTGHSPASSRGAETWSVSGLAATISDQLHEAFPAELWVRGEIHNLSRAPSGHVYFTLVDPDTDSPTSGPPSQLAVILPDANRRRVNRLLQRAGSAVRMSNGTEVRIRGRLDYYAPRGSLQLRMASIDPAFTLGQLAADRATLVAALRAEGVLDQNGRRPMPPFPMRVGVVTSAGSAAEADVIHELGRSGFAFDIVSADVRVQGPDAAASIAGAVAWLGTQGLDVLILARGGGAATDLAAFDQELVVRAIARAPVPVITGIGHEVDRSIADDAAHHAAKTPTAAAGFVAEVVAQSLEQAETTWTRIAALASTRLARADDHLDHAVKRAARAAVTATRSEVGRISARADQLGRAALASLDRQRAEIDAITHRVVTESKSALLLADQSMETTRVRVSAVDPARALARGWAMVRDDSGAIVRGVEGLVEGSVLVTTFVDGSVRSVVSGRPEARPRDDHHRQNDDQASR